MGWLEVIVWRNPALRKRAAHAEFLRPGIRPLIASLLLFGLSGCAYDTVGLLASRVTSAEGAWVVDVYSLGAYLHPRGDDPGLQLGASRRSYVFDKREPDELEPGWHYFAITLPERPAYATDTRSLGIEGSFARNDLSLTLGLRGQTMLARIDAEESRFYRLSYTPARPAETSLQVFELPGGEFACVSCR